MISKFSFKRNGTPARPGSKMLKRIQCHGTPISAQTFQTKRGVAAPSEQSLILTETGSYLNTELSDRITNG